MTTEKSRENRKSAYEKQHIKHNKNNMPKRRKIEGEAAENCAEYKKGVRFRGRPKKTGEDHI